MGLFSYDTFYNLPCHVSLCWDGDKKTTPDVPNMLKLNSEIPVFCIRIHTGISLRKEVYFYSEFVLLVQSAQLGDFWVHGKSAQ